MTNTPISKTGKGGWRGGGRPKGSKTLKRIEQEKAKTYFQERTREKWDKIIDSYFAIAFGYFYEKPVWSNGKMVDTIIYKTAPDRAALNDLVTRVIGKPLEEIAGSLNFSNIKETQATLRKLLKKDVISKT